MLAKSQKQVLIAGLLVLIFVANGNVVASEDRSEWVLPEAAANCILENLDGYVATPSRIVLIVVDNCPDTNPFAGATDNKLNQSGIISNVQTKSEAEGLAKFITYTKQQLQCLRAGRVRYEDGVAYLPKEPLCE